jgi:hypothetical protein
MTAGLAVLRYVPSFMSSRTDITLLQVLPGKTLQGIKEETARMALLASGCRSTTILSSKGPQSSIPLALRRFWMGRACGLWNSRLVDGMVRLTVFL